MADRLHKQHAAKGRTASASHSVRPFQCRWPEGCSKSFNRKSDLQRHYRIHTNERPYACDYKPCEKTFIQRSALTVHRRTHTGDKPHKCPYVNCGKCFSDSSSLARHRRIHTNDKPYICKNSRCRKAFCRKTTMTKHFRKEHPAESLDDDDEAEYSDVDESDEEGTDLATNLTRDGSPGSLQSPGAYRDTPPAPKRASTYSAALWSLPGHSTQSPKPLHMRAGLKARRDSATELVKLERSLSGTPQRTMTEPFPCTHEQQREYMRAVSGAAPDPMTAPSSVPQSVFLDGNPQPFLTDANAAALWHSHATVSDSPTSMTSSASAVDRSQSAFPTPTFPSQPMALSQQQQINRYSAQAQMSNLHGLPDTIMDEAPPPPSFRNMAISQAHQPQSYTSAAGPPSSNFSQHPHPGHQQSQEHGFSSNETDSHVKSHHPLYNDGGSPPGTLQSSIYAKSGELPFQEPHFAPTAPPELFHMPNQYPPPTNSLYYPDMSGVKEWKDDPWVQLPAQVLGWP